MDRPTLKIAFSGSSGSGKTTLVKHVSSKFNIPHISGSAGDLKNKIDAEILRQLCGSDPLPDGHREVIRYSSINPLYGIVNQMLLQARRTEVLRANHSFVTDRSPADNFTYFMSQCGHLDRVDDALCEKMFAACVDAMSHLDLMIYVKAVQPRDLGVENNGSRVDNWWWQQSIDFQFDKWLDWMFCELRKRVEYTPIPVPRVVVIGYWELEKRKSAVDDAIEELIATKKWQP